MRQRQHSTRAAAALAALALVLLTSARALAQDVRPGDEQTRRVAEIHAALRAGLENGALRPILSREIPLAEAPRAHEAVMESGAHGKIVLIP